MVGVQRKESGKGVNLRRPKCNRITKNQQKKGKKNEEIGNTG